MTGFLRGENKLVFRNNPLSISQIKEEFFEYDDTYLKQYIYVVDEKSYLATFYRDIIADESIVQLKTFTQKGIKIFNTDLSGLFIIKEISGDEIFSIKTGEYITFKIVKNT